jgi:hypothetical protein
MLGSRGVYHEGWKAVTFKPLGRMYDDGLDPDAPFDDDVWELYHVATDLTECDDLAATHVEKLAELVDVWWTEARRFQVLPLDNRPVAALLAPRRPFDTRARYVFWPGGALVPETVTVNVRDRTHSMVATVEVASESPPEGVLLAMGNALGGWSFHVHRGCLRYVNNYLGKERHVVESDVPLTSGPHELAFSFTSAGGFRGTGRLLVDGRIVGEAEIPHVTPVRYSITGGGITCGWEQGPPVGTDYEAPFAFTGTVRRVVVEVDGQPHRDENAEFEAIMSEQ